MKIKLTKDQMQQVYDALDEIDENGSFDKDIEIELANNQWLTINAKGYLYVDGYREDDYHCGYMNGTGAWVETYRSASVELTAKLFDEDGDEIEGVELDEAHEKNLNIAA